ncbi:hypothetical protein O181_005883 [Austropuccinia psidii MF-1]|uniref:Transcription factor TFIIIC subunit tfc4 n=1 Tax=Austropuccinia psidii MF-1 TaxID=1389203 RepID=A0A9Q3BJD6_9BASI|nr:hypothetical protein [Austropuccinia psidii MF-1]
MAAQIPIDPNLFNPEVVGAEPSRSLLSKPSTSFASVFAGSDENYYPPEDDWDLENDDDFYYEPDQEELDEEHQDINFSAFKSGRNRSGAKQLASDAEGSSSVAEGDDESSEDNSDPEVDSDDLHRLIGAIHAKGPNNEDESRGLLGKEWDRNMDEELNEMQEAEKAMRPGRRKKSKLRGEPEISREVSMLLGEANLCFIEKKYDEAIPLFQEIVRIEPLCKMAWNNLGAIYQDLGNFEKSCQFRIIGAHLSVKSAEIWKELGAESRQHGLLSQAIYCYGEAIKAGKGEVEAMWDRSYLLYEIGRPRQALTSYLAILKLMPHNPDVLREVAHLCATTDEKDQPIKLFQEAFDHYRSTIPVPSEQWLRDGFGLGHIRTLITLLMKSHLPTPDDGQASAEAIAEEKRRVYDHYRDTLKIIKQATRWLQGRIDSSSENCLDWDVLEDDREYDLQRQTREGWDTLADLRYENCPTYSLENDFRAYLGICRLKMGDEDEAELHFEIIKMLEIEEVAELLMIIGDVYFEYSRWDEALEYYHDLAANDSTNNPNVWHKIGRCYRNAGNLEGALECYEAISETDPLDLVAKTQLAELYELLGDREKAFATVNDLVEIRRSARESGTIIEKDVNLSNSVRNKSNNPLASRNPMAKSVAERWLDEEIQTRQYVQTYERLESISSQLSTVELLNDSTLITEYIKLANPLVEGFRQTPALFPSDLSSKFGGLAPNPFRSAKRGDSATKTVNSEKTDSAPITQEFRGIVFTNWVRIFVYYAFSCAKLQRLDEACEVLNHVMRAPTFRQSAPMQQVLRLAYISTCFAKEDFLEVTDTIRWLSKRLPFHNDPIRLINTLLCQGFQPSIAFFNANIQKWLLRQLQIIDGFIGQRVHKTTCNEGEDEEILTPIHNETADCVIQSRPKGATKHSLKRSTGRLHCEMMREDEDEDEDDSYWKPSKYKPSKTSPVFTITFSQILAGTRSFKSAIIYYLRLFEFYPDEPLLNLSLAVAYVQRAMQRQTDNRHHQIVQSLSFFDNYRRLRTKKFGQEVEYNLGRLFHGLGLTTLAVRHYHRVLSLSSSEREGSDRNDTDLSGMAAYNLVLIYSTCGSPDLAHEIMTEYLSV